MMLKDVPENKRTTLDKQLKKEIELLEKHQQSIDNIIKKLQHKKRVSRARKQFIIDVRRNRISLGTLRKKLSKKW